MITRAKIASLIDHTLLKPEATAAQVDALVAEAAALGAYSVCISPSLLPLNLPAGLHLATVCGFPSGAHATSVKAAEAADAVAKGAEEVDMVVNLRLVKEGDFDAVEADIRGVREACRGALLKVIIGDRLGVKASGGIRTAADALAMVEAGANRLGLSATAAVLEGLDD